jgi:hypothetical protein
MLAMAIGWDHHSPPVFVDASCVEGGKLFALLLMAAGCEAE